MSTRTEAGIDTRLFVGGEFVEAEGGRIFGRFGGTAVVDEFTGMRWITVQRGSHPLPF